MDDMPEDLSARVLRWGKSMPRMESAARVLAVTPWLRDRSFVEACIVAVDDGDGEPMALVDWAAVAEFLALEPDGDPDEVGALRVAFDLASKAWDDLDDTGGAGP